MQNNKNSFSDKKHFNIHTMALTSIMTAVICILSPFSLPLPFSPVPLTLGSLSIYLAVYILGMKQGLLSYAIYFLLGTAGLPVFSGFSGGFGKIAGPTGGYLIGFFFLAVIQGFFVDTWHGKKHMALIGMSLGTIACYLFGTLWLSRLLNISFAAGLTVGVLPYLPGDAAKMAAAVILGSSVRKVLKRASLQP